MRKIWRLILWGVCHDKRQDTAACVTPRQDAAVCITPRQDTLVCVTPCHDTAVCVTPRQDTAVCVTPRQDTAACVTPRQDTAVWVIPRQLFPSLSRQYLALPNYGPKFGMRSGKIARRLEAFFGWRPRGTRGRHCWTHRWKIECRQPKYCRSYHRQWPLLCPTCLCKVMLSWSTHTNCPI